MKEKARTIRRKLLSVMLSCFMVIGMILPSIPTNAGPGGVDKSVTDLNLAHLSLYEFKCTQENMQVVSLGSGTLEEHIAANGSWKKSTVFMHKYNKRHTSKTMRMPWSSCLPMPVKSTEKR